MVARGRGHILNIASLAGIAPVAGLTLYSASKFAVRGFTLAAATDLKPHGVAVTVVCPDAVATPMLALQEDFAEAALTFSGSKPLTVEEVGSAILDALESRPLEVALPHSRAILARFASAAPGLASHVDPWLRKKGIRTQATIRKRRER
jgi:3-oxoacyl-[acyl-carrier protein] reductase